MQDSSPFERPVDPTATPNAGADLGANALPDADEVPSADDRNLALIAHLSGCAGLLAGGLIGFLGPLIIYLLKKDTSVYVGEQAKEALNFQITLLVITVACIVLFVVSCGVLFPLVFVPMILQLVFGIIAAIAVRDGSPYRYPFNLRLMQ